MREFDLQPDKIEINEEVDQKQYQKIITKERVPKGCNLYSFNLNTKKFQKVEFEPLEPTLLKEPKTLTMTHILNQIPLESDAEFKYNVDPECLYEIASNFKNAARKFNKRPELRLMNIAIKLTKDHKK